MGWLKKGAIIAAAVIVSVGVIFLWFAAYAEGQDRGYTEGYDTGHTEGYDGGYAEGYGKGQLEGYNEGHSEGYNRGQLEGYKEGHGKGYLAGYATAISEGFLVNPSYQEMKEFLKADRTDAKPWVEGEYDTRNMVADINKNAEAQGIRAAEVYIEFPNYSYTLVAFETTDRGLIFIEPQDDAEMKVAVGIKYYEDNGYGKPGWDDTIEEVVISW